MLPPEASPSCSPASGQPGNFASAGPVSRLNEVIPIRSLACALSSESAGGGPLRLTQCLRPATPSARLEPRQAVAAFEQLLQRLHPPLL